MAPSKSKKRKRVSSVKKDMLSNLPQEIKEQILMYLPIKEAGRTSILSSKWRYIWTSIPELKFVDNEIIEIREIELDLSYSEESSYSIMHSSFFAWDELNCAKLKNCYFELPLWFEEFKLLDTLEIRNSLISRRYLEKLVSSCSLLKKLVLILDLCFDPKTVMKIHASNLEHLEIKDVSKAEIVDLERCDLQICAQRLETLKLYGSFNDIQIIAPNIESLEIKDRYSDFQLSAPNLSYLCVQLNVPDLRKVHIKDVKVGYWRSERYTGGRGPLGRHEA
ncbi:hypothetical protein LUZ60_011692 [Juncus effusus]|nr:hypothetical protein LUZ60_011692 [Juncus effusus]